MFKPLKVVLVCGTVTFCFATLEAPAQDCAWDNSIGIPGMTEVDGGTFMFGRWPSSTTEPCDRFGWGDSPPSRRRARQSHYQMGSFQEFRGRFQRDWPVVVYRRAEAAIAAPGDACPALARGRLGSRRRLPSCAIAFAAVLS
jgi:hypothetical protein